MNHFTHQNNSPRKECLNFLRTFARLYSPETDNEHEARRMAHDIAYGMVPEC